LLNSMIFMMKELSHHPLWLWPTPFFTESDILHNLPNTCKTFPNRGL
jgi:hypothetical protein